MASNSSTFNLDGKNEVVVSSDRSSPLLARRGTLGGSSTPRSLSSLPRCGRRLSFQKSLSAPSIDSIVYFYDNNGKIKIGELLGSGSYSSVYLGIRVDDDCVDTGERVALKLLNRESAIKLSQLFTPKTGDSIGDSNDSNDRNFCSEYNILNEYHKSKYIVEFFGLISTEPYPIKSNTIHGFSLQYCHHGDLNTYMNSHRQTDPTRTHQWVIEIAECISALHSIIPPIIHRDIKSSNFLIDSDQHIKITDFGLSRPFVDGNKNDTFGRLRTSLFYIPPEIVNINEDKNSTCDKSNTIENNIYCLPSDIYSTTIVIWEVINWTLRGFYSKPFDVKNSWMIIGLLNKGIRPNIDDFTSEWKDFLNRGWHSNPMERFLIDEMIDQLESLPVLLPISP